MRLFVQLRDTALTDVELATRFGISAQAIGKWRRKWGLKPKDVLHAHGLTAAWQWVNAAKKQAKKGQHKAARDLLIATGDVVVQPDQPPVQVQIGMVWTLPAQTDALAMLPVRITADAADSPHGNGET